MDKIDTYVVLNKSNFIHEIFNFNGYFLDQIPPCFATASLATAFKDSGFYNKITGKYNARELKAYPLEVSIHKEGLLRRTLSFPNIFAYIRLLGVLKEHFDLYAPLLESENTESSPLIITNLDYPSNYRKSIMDRGNKFSGTSYKLSIDIANCYSSIYSHSIGWALLGKDEVKRQYFLDKRAQTSDYKKTSEIDNFNNKLKANETNGLLTGPYSSRIISEIILGALDKILREKFNFTRYVDDYNFYFTSKHEAESAIGIIAAILNDYNLKINETKISIKKYPFDVLDDYQSEFKLMFNKKFPAYDILQKAALMENEGKKGAYKYAFKLLRNNLDLINKNSDNEVYYLFYNLLSIIVNKPMLARYAVEMISKLNVVFSENEMVDKLNEILEKELNSGHDQEVLWLLYIIIKYGSKLKLDNMLKILSSQNDLAIMMMLDLIENNPKQILEFDKRKRDWRNKLKKSLVALENLLIDENLLSKRWFLLYEINYLGLKPLKVFNNIKINNPLYNDLKNKKVNFYISIVNRH